MNSTGTTSRPSPEELCEVIHWALAYMVYRQGGEKTIILPDNREDTSKYTSAENDGFDMTIVRDGQFLTITVTHD